MANTARSPIAGHNIYLNEHNQKVLFDPITKTGYLIRETEAQKFTLYHNRWILALAIGILVYSFTDKIPLSILTSFLYGAIQEYRYRKVWLPGLTQYPNFKPKNKVAFIQGLIQQNKIWDCLVLGIAFLTFGILFVINGIQKHNGPILIGFEVIVMISTSWKAIQYFIAFYKLLKLKKKR